MLQKKYGNGSIWSCGTVSLSTPNMNFRIITDADSIDRKQWERFVYDHPQGNVFQTPQMYAAYVATKKYRPIVVACYEDDSLVGILLAVVQKEYKGLLGKLSARSIIWGGPLAYSKDVIFKLLNQYNKIVKKKAIYSQFRNLYYQNSFQKEPFEINGFSYENHLNILVDLTVGVDEFWKVIKSNRKKGINKAKSQGFVFEISNTAIYLESFYKLLEETYKSVKLPYPDKDFFISLNSELPEFTRWFVLKKNNEPIIVLIALVYKGIIRPFYIGSTKDNFLLNLRPTDIFHYNVMCWGIENGFHTFDWMGAGKPDQEYGVRRFKLQYGGELIDMGRYKKIHQPVLMQIAATGFKMWRLLKGIR